MPAPTFYSKAERAVEASQQKTLSVDQAVSLATKGIPKAEYEWSGVVDWLEGRKEEGEGKVSKAELLEFLQNKGVKVEEVYRSGRSEEPFDVFVDTGEAKWAAGQEGDLLQYDVEASSSGTPLSLADYGYYTVLYDQDAGNVAVKRDDGTWIATDVFDPINQQDVNTARLAIKADMKRRFHKPESTIPEGAEGPTLFKPGESDWVMLPGDEKAQQSYGELVLTLPDSNANQRNTLAAEVDRRKSRIRGLGDEIKKLEIKLPTEHELKEGLSPSVESWLNTEVKPKLKVLHADLDLEVQKLEPFTKRLATLGPYRETFDLPSGHRFPESNILAHIRFTERVDADGKKMLFIEELQSDWSNEGRSSGWKKERPPEVQKEIQRLKVEREEKVIAKAEEIGLFNELYDSPDKVSTEAKKNAVRRFWDNQTPFDADYYPPDSKAAKMKQQLRDSASDVISRIAELEAKYPSNPSGAPDMPFKGDNRYGALALKRMIRWAADNGFDRLGWITGKDTAERYNLSKVIDEIAVPSVDANSRSVRLDTGEGDSFKLTVDNEGKVDGVLKASQFTGKQLDEVIGKELAKKVMDFKAPGKLAGADLEVGGEWATTLYDKVLPTQAKKIVKKKGAVGRTRLGTPEAQTVGSKDRLSYALYELGYQDLLSGQREVVDSKLQTEAASKIPEANYVDITPEVKALAEEGFSYFMPPGGGKGRAAAPAQPASTLPATPIMPRVKLTDREKEDSRRLLNLLKEKGI
jgi:hypothetical protein